MDVAIVAINNNYRDEAAANTDLIAESRNALPALLDAAEALQTFADYAGCLSSSDDGDLRIELRHPHSSRSSYVTVGDFRRAAAAIRKLKG